MAHYTESIVINRPVDVVFAYMNDLSREQEWQPGIQSAEQVPPGPQTVGTTRRYQSSFLGKKLRNVYVNRIYEPNRRVAYVSTAESDLTASADISFETAAGGTRVTMALEVEPPKKMRLVPKAMLDSTSRKQLRDSLSRLKSNLER